MIIESYEYVIYTAMFLLPGYLINWIISILVPQRSGDQTDKVLRYLGYSLLNFTAWIWLFWLIRRNIEADRTIYWFLLSLTVMATSFLTGVLLGVIRNKGCFRKLFAKYGLQIEHPIPTAWDYKFSKISAPRWVTVSLINGKRLRGYLGGNSMASSDEEFRDLYLELSYIQNGEGKPWEILPQTDGVWISPGQIAYIEFLEL